MSYSDTYYRLHGDIIGFRQYTEIATFLIKHKANLDAKNKHGSTALLVCAYDGQTDIALQLIKAHASVDICNDKGTTALMAASGGSHVEIVQAILDAIEQAGSDPLVKNMIDRCDEKGLSALMLACNSQNSQNRLRTINTLIAAGAKLDLVDKEGNTALMLAIQSKLPEASLALIEAGCDVENSNQNGMTPLLLALERGVLDVAQREYLLFFLIFLLILPMR